MSDKQTNERVGLLVYMLIGLLDKVIRSATEEDYHLHLEASWNEHVALPYFALGIKQLEARDPKDHVSVYYTVVAKTPKTPIPIDVIDFFINGEAICYRFNGLENPIATKEGYMLLDQVQFSRVFSVAIETNHDLMDLIKSHKGGSHEIKSVGK